MAEKLKIRPTAGLLAGALVTLTLWLALQNAVLLAFALGSHASSARVALEALGRVAAHLAPAVALAAAAACTAALMLAALLREPRRYERSGGRS